MLNRRRHAGATRACARPPTVVCSDARAVLYDYHAWLRFVHVGVVTARHPCLVGKVECLRIENKH